MQLSVCDPLRTLAKDACCRLNMSNTSAPPFYAPPRWEGAVIAIGAFLVFVLLTRLFGGGRASIAGAFVDCFGLAVRICWPLRQKVWLWIVMLALAGLHGAVLAFFDWSAAARWTGFTMMPFMTADITLVLGVIFLIYRTVYGPPAQLFAFPEPRYSEETDGGT